MRPKYKIALIIPYFGRWPEWAGYFLHSCIHNPDMDWIFPSDHPPREFRGPNLHFPPFALEEFNLMAGEKLGMDLDIRHPYKICDLKPAYGEIFEELIGEYDFWGYGDMDLVYGNLRRFLPDSRLDDADILAGHTDFVPGHFCLLRNSLEIRSLYRMGEAYRRAFASSFYTGFDEQIKRQGINPDPARLERELALDRRGHVSRYRIKVKARGLMPTLPRFPLVKSPCRRLKDFSSIVRCAEARGQIRVSRSRDFESDLMLEKRGERDWETRWNKGKLSNRQGKEILYFHFLLSKSSGSFRIKEYKGGLKEFRLHPGGISR